MCVHMCVSLDVCDGDATGGVAFKMGWMGRCIVDIVMAGIMTILIPN